MPGSSRTLFDTILIVLGLLSVLKKKRDFVCVKSLAILTQNLDILECFLLRQGGHGTGKTGNLVLTFSRQGKHREFCFDTGKKFETQGKYFSVTQGEI